MALLVHVKDTNILGNQLNLAINQIRDGIAFFEKYDGLRAQTIGVSAAKLGSVFGVEDATEAQALSDRWAKISVGTCTYAELVEFIDATVRSA
jgi:hypothetical protein